MRNLYNEVQKLDEGTYLIKPEGIVNYAERWAYGYIVGVRELNLTDLKNGTIFGKWLDSSDEFQYDIVKHVAAKQDAIKLARDYDQTYIYDLRMEEVIPV